MADTKLTESTPLFHPASAIRSDAKRDAIPRREKRDVVAGKDALAAFEKTAEQARKKFTDNEAVQKLVEDLNTQYSLMNLEPQIDQEEYKKRAAAAQQRGFLTPNMEQEKAARDFLRFFAQKITNADEMALVAKLQESAKDSTSLDEATQKARLAMITELEQALVTQIKNEEQQTLKEALEKQSLDNNRYNRVKECLSLTQKLAERAKHDAEATLKTIEEDRAANEKVVYWNTIIANLTAGSLGLLAAALSINDGILSDMGGPSVGAKAADILNYTVGSLFATTGALELIKAISEIVYLHKNRDKMDNWQRASKIASITASFGAFQGCLMAACKHIFSVNLGAQYAGPIVFPAVFAISAASNLLNLCHVIKDYFHGHGSWRNIVLAIAQSANSLLSLGGVLYSGGLVATGPVGWAILALTVLAGFACKYIEKRLKEDPVYLTREKARLANAELHDQQKNVDEESRVKAYSGL